ncbi:MAG: hypothetical protein QOG60_1034, partial [Frankiaceae bacterium]|nr:hypothetical protein [Frankiaceae bacterium]
TTTAAASTPTDRRARDETRLLLLLTEADVRMGQPSFEPLVGSIEGEGSGSRTSDPVEPNHGRPAV